MSSFRALIVLAVAALSGCASSPPPRTDVQAKDNGAGLPLLRVSKDIAESVALEFTASRASGSGSQSLAGAAAPVEYNGFVFPAPQTLRHEFDLAIFEAAGRWRHFFQDSALGVELLAGFAYTELDLEIAGAAGRARGSESAFGPVFGAGLVWRVASSTSVQGRFTAYAAFAPDESGMRLELALVQALGRHLAVRAGYAHTRFEFDQDSASIVDVRASGPMLGLELRF